MEAINKYRRGRKALCKQLGVNMKQLRKRRILRNYRYIDRLGGFFLVAKFKEEVFREVALAESAQNVMVGEKIEASFWQKIKEWIKAFFHIKEEKKK